MIHKKQKFKKKSAIVFCAVASLSLSLVQTTFAALGWTVPGAPTNTPTNFDTVLLNITNWILGFVTAISVLALIWGGVSYIGSAGNEDQAKTAKRTISYAIIGLVIAGIAYAVVKVVVETILKA